MSCFGWQATIETRACSGASIAGSLPIGPSLLANGHMITLSAPDVASDLPPALHDIDLTRPGYPVMRMCLASASRQPCKAGSCIAVTRNLLSGLKVTPRCEPAHPRNSGCAAMLGNHNVTPL